MNKSMNILFLTYQGDMAGSTNSISYLAHGLAEKGHHVYVGCRKESLLYRLLSNSKVKLLPMVFKGRFDLKNIQEIRKIVKKYNIQVINAQSSWDRYTSIFARWIYNLNVRIVHTRRQRPRSIGGFLQNWFYVKGTDKIVVISDELKKFFIEMGIPADHLKVIYNGTPAEIYQNIDPGLINALRKKHNINDTDIVIGSVSRLKNQEQIIRALTKLDNEIIVIFVGIEPGTFDELVNKLNIKNRIIYAGKVDRKTVMHYYKIMNLNILASTMDGFGLVLVEAMALGTPVLATNFGGIKNVVTDGDDGLLFEDNNIEELAEKINLLIANRELRNKLIHNGRKTAFEKFSMENTVNSYEKFFQLLIEEHE